MNVLHILNVADWALVGAGVAATLLMILIGGHEDGSRDDKKAAGRRQRPSKTAR